MEEKAKVDEIINQQRSEKSEFIKNKLKREQKRSWDIFYKRNTENAYKDRHWTIKEFEELNELESKTLLELGCGVGNFVFPLKRKINFKVHMCDISPRAIEFVKTNPEFSSDINAFVCDLTQDSLIDFIEPESVDIVTAVFVLSAIHPDNLNSCIENIMRVLKPGGCILLRDYGVNDAAMLRFKKDNYIADNFYCRGDGTYSVFFSPEQIERLFSGHLILENEFKLKEVVNRQRELTMNRIFIQARIQKCTAN